MPILRAIAIVVGMTLPAAAQAPVREESWTLEYDRVRRSMHGESPTVREKAQLTFRRSKDSIVGTLRIADPGSPADVRIVRGVARRDTLAFEVETPRRQGIAVVLSAVEVAMDWLRQTVHGVEPELTEFRLRVRGDSLNGTRSVSGGVGRPVEPARVAGARR